MSYKEKLNQVKTFLFDVDGVFTDGTIIVSDNEYLRAFNAKDAFALQLAVKKGYRCLVITGGQSPSIKRTLEGLGCQEVVLKSSNKLVVYEDLKKRYDFQDSEALYVGDDLPDIPVLKQVNVAVCPQDASPDVKLVCDYQSLYVGGKGCVRDIIEQVLRVQGHWNLDENHEW